MYNIYDGYLLTNFVKLIFFNIDNGPKSYSKHTVTHNKPIDYSYHVRVDNIVDMDISVEKDVS